MNRVWTFTISKALNARQLDQLLEAGKAFAAGWTAHDQQLTATFEIVGNTILVVKVNEEVTGASGCSIDKLTRFVKEMEQAFGIELMNRLLVAYKEGEDIKVTHSSKIKELLAQGILNEGSTIYNTAVANEDELNHWEQPLKATWLNKYLN